MEISLVLLLASLILGAVWVAAAKVRISNGVYRINREVVEVSQNIREQYVGVQKPSAWATDGMALNVLLDAKNVFLAEMRVDPTLAAGDTNQEINHPMATLTNGSFRVFYTGNAATTTLSPTGPASCSTTVPCFRIWLYGLSGELCNRLIRALPIDDAQMGIAQLGTTSVGGTCTGTTCVSTASVPVTTAQTWCDGAGTDNTLFWDFKLHNG